MLTTAPWYLSPVFLASLGAFAALGLLMLAAAYFVLTKMRPTKEQTYTQSSDTCKSHEGLDIRIRSLEKWRDNHSGEHAAQIQRKIDELRREREDGKR